MFGLARCVCAVGLVHVILAQQLFPNEPPCAERCYADAVSASGCAADDLACRCRVPNLAGIGLAAGPCFLTQCNLVDLSVLSSALTAACSSTSSPTGTSAPTTRSTAAGSASASPPSGAASAPASTALRPAPSAAAAAVQAVPDNDMMAASGGQGQGQTLNAAAITGIVVSGAAVGLIGGILMYFFTVVRRRKMDQAQWDELEREKVAMQRSLDELKMAVQRAETFDGLDEKKGGGGKKRPKTINLTGSNGPGELGVPSRIFELPASPAKLEKM